MINQDVPGLNRTIHVTNNWLKEIAEEMGASDAQVAYHALRGVLFATRDRLAVEEAAHLAAQLPALIRGIYYEGYRPADKPSTYRNRDEYLQRIRTELEAADGEDPEAAARAVLTVLNRHVTAGELDDVRAMLPEPVRELWPAA